MLTCDAAHGTVEILGPRAGGARNFGIEETLLGGGDEVVQQRALAGAAGLVKVVLKLAELVLENPAPGGRLVLEIFERDEKSAAETRQQLLGNDADQLGCQQIEGTGGGVDEIA